MLRAAFLAFVVSALCKAGFAQTQLPTTDVLDIHRTDPGRINRQPSLDRIKPLAVSLGRANGARTGQTTLVEYVDLQMDALLRAGAEKVPSSSSDDASEMYFSLVIDGNEYVLDIVEAAWDHVFEAHHILAAIVNGPAEAYARFSIDPASGAVAGTVHNGVRRFRILSSDDLDTQLVYALKGRKRDEMVTTGEGARPEVGRIERRQAQAERIAEIRPEFFVSGVKGGTVLLGGDIGTLSIDEVGTAEGVKQLLTDLNLFTNATGDEEIEILFVTLPEEEEEEEDGVTQITYRQVIAGIPIVHKSNIEVWPDGRVKRVSSVLVDPSIAPDPSDLIAAEEAQRIARAALLEELPGLSETPFFASDPTELNLTLGYFFDEDSLKPLWLGNVTLRTPGGPYRFAARSVRINALTGDVAISDGLVGYFDQDARRGLADSRVLQAGRTRQSAPRRASAAEPGGDDGAVPRRGSRAELRAGGCDEGRSQCGFGS